MGKKKKKKHSLKESNHVTNADERWIKKNKLLTQGLILSGALNIGLLAAFIYKASFDKRSHTEFAFKPAKHELSMLIDYRSLKEVVEHLDSLSYEQLVNQLDNNHVVENGITVRDLSLGFLIDRYHFDFNRALSGQQFSTRKIALDDSGQYFLTLVSSLLDSDYEAIKYFEHIEEWPYTSQGMFSKLLEVNEKEKESLLKAFVLTDEFLAVETLFNSSGKPIDRASLIQLLEEGSWEYLQAFVAKQRQGMDCSEERRQEFLIDYVAMGSGKAADLLVELDHSFLIKKTSNETLSAILKLLEHNSKNEEFVLAILTSARDEELCEQAGKKLYAWSDIKCPNPYDPIAAMILFASKIPAQAEVDTRDLNSTSLESKAYVVMEGDTLWKISKKLGVDLATLKSVNNLESDLIKTGQTLQVP